MIVHSGPWRNPHLTAQGLSVQLQNGLLNVYLSGNGGVYKCPADIYLAPLQRALGWKARARSISMNAFFGPYSRSPHDPGTYWGANQKQFFQAYRQWLKLAEVSRPAGYWVTIDEHPDSINDGYFLNNPANNGAGYWGNLREPETGPEANCSLGRRCWEDESVSPRLPLRHRARQEERSITAEYAKYAESCGPPEARLRVRAGAGRWGQENGKYPASTMFIEVVSWLLACGGFGRGSKMAMKATSRKPPAMIGRQNSSLRISGLLDRTGFIALLLTT